MGQPGSGQKSNGTFKLGNLRRTHKGTAYKNVGRVQEKQQRMGQGSITTLHPSLNEWGEEVVTGIKKVSCGEKAIWEDLWPLVEEHSWEDEGINILTLLSSCSPDLLPMSSTSQTQWKNGGKGNCRCIPYGQPPRAPGRMKDGKWICGVKWKMSIIGLPISMLLSLLLPLFSPQSR